MLLCMYMMINLNFGTNVLYRMATVQFHKRCWILWFMLQYHLSTTVEIFWLVFLPCLWLSQTWRLFDFRMCYINWPTRWMGLVWRRICRLFVNYSALEIDRTVTHKTVVLTFFDDCLATASWFSLPLFSLSRIHGNYACVIFSVAKYQLRQAFVKMKEIWIIRETLTKHLGSRVAESFN